MEYEQFFTKAPEVNPTAVQLAILVVLTLNLLVQCTSSCKTNVRVQVLERENEGLKCLVLKIVDQALVRMLKNGSDSDDEPEE